ncbi:MAG: pyrroline-5-carboxylate reductase [Gammaproteobacteria bacterium]|nr:pyrroline-5-carboxylate reductase [Gammaproteobacteria bacterium]
MSQTICFIGAGNMAASLIGGLIANQHDAAQITACDIDAAQLARLQIRFGIDTSQDSLAGARRAGIVMLAVKPQAMRAVCEQLAALPADSEQLFISIAAGVPAQAIDRWLGGGRAIVRCMPNTPALLQLGATGLAANDRVSESQQAAAEKIMQAVGISIWVDTEADLDAVTAISGSGPAYFFYFIELLEAAGVELGLPPDTAGRLARQTALGAATMAQGKDVAELRAQVTSNKGTTEQAILSFQQNHLDRLVREATAAAHRRALELASELTEDQVQ